MGAGKGWVLVEVFSHINEKRLLSVLSPRKTPDQVRQYVEHRYVDAYGSTQEKIAYKKRRNSWPYPAEAIDRLYPYIIQCGHEPFFMAMYCYQLKLKNNKLSFWYKHLTGQEADQRPFLGSFLMKWGSPNKAVKSFACGSLGRSALCACSGMASLFFPEQALHAERRLPGRYVH